jgi:SWI/SNF-related matrix-associated actin-dependent regulator of chromatin subfamily A member 5
LQSLQAEHRLLLTGTPLQNNLKEMWALLHWLMPEVFTDDTQRSFQDAFNLGKGKVSTTFMDDCRKLLELLMLRRMKSSPGVNLGLPPKEEVLLYVPLTPMQRFWYTRLLTRTDQATLDDLFRGAGAKALKAEAEDDSLQKLVNASTSVQGSEDAWHESREIIQKALDKEQQEEAADGGQWRKLMSLITELRKTCIHPYIMGAAEPDPYFLGDHVRTASGKFILLDKLVDQLVVKERRKIIIFAGWTSILNLTEDMLATKGAKDQNAPFRYLRLDGQTNRAKRNLSIRMFNDEQSDHRIMLLSTRAGGLGINLVSASAVIFMDEDWNPQVTVQAEARAHRIGQTKKVTVYKLCTQGTVEEQMLGRIRKKLFLSAKITESMRNIHTVGNTETKKRKRSSGVDNDGQAKDEPALSTGQLKSLLRLGARTLARPEVDMTAMLNWDFDTMIRECKDKADDQTSEDDVDEDAWLNTMEKVETTVFEGKKHHAKIDTKEAVQLELTRADRREGKNTTVMVDGFMINKESIQCGDWEAVPTFAGKDPRLADRPRAKKAKIENQTICQCCWDGGQLILCSGCPRSYHYKCMDVDFKAKSRGKMHFYCSQHECAECGAKTGDAGGMLYRCRWCEKAYCEDCNEWDVATLVGNTLPEHEMLGFGEVTQAVSGHHILSAKWFVADDLRSTT